MKILMIDNYDSFTYNLYQLIGRFNKDITVKRNDKITVDEIKDFSPDKIVISPGPGRPEDANISTSVIEELGKDIPILGVCLGHQCIGHVFGAEICQAPTIMHGKVSKVQHNDEDIFSGVPQNFDAGRYHSLIINCLNVPDCFEITATTQDSIIMGIKHKDFQLIGIQFHPESILTNVGNQLIKNWLEL